MNHKLPTATYTDSAAIAWHLFCDPVAARDGFGRPFELGLRPLGHDPWPIVDQYYAQDIQQKKKLQMRKPDQVWRALPGYGTAQMEAYETIFGDASPISSDALFLAGQQVQEDLVIMAPSDKGHILAVGHVCFPSSWRLAEKHGKPMAAVHDPVPQFGEGTRTAMMIERMFSHLKPDQPMQRLNWSLMLTNQLHTPFGHEQDIEFQQDWESLTLRMERQTLHKLPNSNCVLFTIRIFVEPLAALKAHAEPEHWAGFIQQVNAMDADQLAYKGIARL